MKKSVFFIGIALALYSCGGSSGSGARQQAIELIKKEETKMHASDQLAPEVADSAVLAYTAFADQFKTDPLAPDFLFKSAEICTATRKYQQARTYYQRIRADYPDYPLYIESCFLEASLLDNYMDMDGDAKTLYLKLIEDFPDSPYANDAKIALQNLGKSDEELIKEFKEKNHQQ